MRIPHLFTGTAVLAVLALPVLAQGQSQLSQDSQEFVKNAAISSQFGVESSQLAVSKAQDPEIKDFAQKMVQENQEIGQNLKSTLSQANAEMEPPQTLDEDHQKKIDELKQAQGEEFDKKYVEAQVEAHEDAVSVFEDYAEDGENQQLQQLAQQTLPVLQENKSQAQQLKDQL